MLSLVPVFRNLIGSVQVYIKACRLANPRSFDVRFDLDF